MAVFKCKMCGATLNIEKDKNIVECEYCGTKQTVPIIKTKEIEELYDRANYFFHNNEYDKAASIYENISTENPYDPESYFMLSLCKYGIEYVEDPKNKKRIPTLHRLHYESINNDVNFKKAIKHADSTQKILYEQEAKYIDEVRNKILDISKKEKPYDVFICYKETDEKGQRTEDSVLAMDIYNELTKEGLKVFFSKITLEDKLGIDYEPYIFAALNSAKVMVVVGTKPEYINSPWVRNEWTRFLDRINKNKSNKKSIDSCYIVPAYKGMSPYALPNEFSSIQAQDMSKVGAIQDLVYGVKKLIDKKEETSISEAKINKKIGKLSIIGVLLVAIFSIVLAIIVIKAGNSNKKILIRGTEYNVNEENSTITLEGITNLNEKDIKQLKRIKSIGNLYFKNCILENLDFLCELKNVKGVQFDSSAKVNDCILKGICENIEDFKISGNRASIWDSVECIEKMPNLKNLQLPLCKDLSPVSNHNKLVDLMIFTNDKYTIMDNFLWCKGLENVEKISFINYAGSIDFVGTDTLFKGIENLKNIKSLNIKGSIDGKFAWRQEDINYISQLNNLESLDITLSGTSSGVDLSDDKYCIYLNKLQNMKKLKSIKIHGYNKFNLEGIGALMELSEIEFSGGDIDNENLNCLYGLTKLESLSLEIKGPRVLSFTYEDNKKINNFDNKKFSLKGIEYLKNLNFFRITLSTNTEYIELYDEDLVKNNVNLKYNKIVK